MKQALEKIKDSVLAELADVTSTKALEDLRVKILGKKGELTAILKQMGRLSPEERPVIGQLANEVRSAIEQSLAQRQTALKAQDIAKSLEDEAIDVTMPGKSPTLGKRHPLNIVLDEMKEIFMGMGYDVVEGPEIEWSKYNFDMLNTPEGHPARDEQDTFYV
ncbi:MAG TPA: phenylalanine--tRNA ligase subunit alpha, partial [Oscillospiraceae bacterium]|nr:phenylalanine--tRNA ligase subunit alpha [Oscillospiraceae bacterium]